MCTTNFILSIFVYALTRSCTKNKEGCSLYTLPCSFKSYKACSFLSHTETDDPTEFHLLELLPD